MPFQSLGEYLSAPNQVLDNRIIKASAASKEQSKNWRDVAEATRWNIEDDIEQTMDFFFNVKFNFEDGNTKLRDAHRVVFDERVFEHGCAMANPCSRVENALKVVGEALGHVPEFPQLCIATGSSGTSDDNIGKPDWAVVPPTMEPNEQHTCIAPGETKATKKKINVNLEANNNKWAKKYVMQIAHYSYQRNTRYAWLITPEELVVYRYPTPRPGKAITPEIATFSWVPEPNQKYSISTVLFCLVVFSGLGHDVLPTYKSIAVEHKEKLDKIRQAVEYLPTKQAMDTLSLEMEALSL